jgi:23S rRNA (cytosine1962-C5)-methyltransferase
LLQLTPHFQSFYNRLEKVYKLIGKQAKQQGITCYRLYDKDMPEHPVIIDVYEKDVVVYEYESRHKLSDTDYEMWQDTCVDIIKEILQISDDHLHMKTRRRKKNRDDQYQKVAQTNEYTTVQENGFTFLVNFADFLDTGLFLDHRPTRKMLHKHAANEIILNLFCYTGSFSIYAAGGGAKEVWSLDLSNTYIDWGKRNADQNNSNKSCNMIWKKCDVLQEIDNLPNNYFDTIILDPPTFSNSKMMKNYWDVQEHHAKLIDALWHCVKPNGKIYFSTNATKFLLDEQLKNDWQIKNITAQTTDFDFKDKLRRACFLLIRK